MSNLLTSVAAITLSTVVTVNATAASSCDSYSSVVAMADDYSTWLVAESKRLEVLYYKKNGTKTPPGANIPSLDGTCDGFIQEKKPQEQVDSLPVSIGCLLVAIPTYKLNATDQLSAQVYAKAREGLTKAKLCQHPNNSCSGVAFACATYNALYTELTTRTYAASVKDLRNAYDTYENDSEAVELKFNQCAKSPKSKNLLVLMAAEMACYHGLRLVAD